jgi:hypothetical protein
LRWRSSSRLTSPFTCISSCQKSRPSCASAGSSSSASYHCAANTGALRSPGMQRQISSAVKLRIGAIQRTIASSTWYSAVCAERRATLSARVVYWRSLITSR